VTRRVDEPPWQVTLHDKLDWFVLPAHVDLEMAVEAFGRGVVDLRSMAGLSRLRREAPKTWHLIVWKLTSVRPVNPHSTVRELITSDLFTDQGMPRRADDFGRLKRYRSSARRLDARVGALHARDVHDPLLDRLGRRWSTGPEALAAETVRRDLSLLRRLVARWGEMFYLPARVTRRPKGPGRRQGERAPRTTPGPETVLVVLEVLGSEHRAAAALAGGAGLAESEILPLRVADLDLKRRLVRVRTGRTRGRPGARVLRVESIAAWAFDLLLAEMDWIPGAPSDRLLFPNRDDPSRPRADLNRGFASASRQALDEGAGPVTLGSLRRLWQHVLREGGAPRAALRQSYSLRWAKRGSRRPPWAEEQKRLLDAWTSLLAPPVPVAPHLNLPRHAPSRCGPYEPERPAVPTRPASSRPLPDTCRVVPDPPKPTATPPRRTEVASPPTPPETRRLEQKIGVLLPRNDLDEAAVRGVVRSEIEAALEPLVRQIEVLGASKTSDTDSALTASLATWALACPERAEEFVDRLAALIGQDSTTPTE
jgi:integrase